MARRAARFAHDTGEGSISQNHRAHGGDLIWEIGSGYFGCRHHDGRFDPEAFAVAARDPQVKMIELKLSQGAKPGHGGVLPGPKVTIEIAQARDVPPDEECVSPAMRSAFATPVQMLKFIERLRDLSGGKPIGFKLCIGHPWEWFAICKAMLHTAASWRTSSSLTAPRAALARHCWSSPTMWARRCRKACCWCTTRCTG